MWGRGGRCYWAPQPPPPPAQGCGGGIVVVLAPAGSYTASRLRPLAELYAALGWRCVVCLADVFSLYFPKKIIALARNILHELLKELKVRPVPVVLASYSAGSVGCLYKIIQLLDGTCAMDDTMLQDNYQVVKECLCGQVYDSSPVQFASGMVTQLLDPGVYNVFQPEKFLAWTAKTLASGVDTFFPSRIEAMRTEYWQTLYSTARFGPCLLMCSKDDELAPCHVISSFCQRLRDLGGDVKLIKWSSSGHLDHYLIHEAEYRNAVSELLHKAFINFHRRQGVATGSSNLNLHEAATISSEGFKGVANITSESLLPSSLESPGHAALGHEQRQEMFQLPSFEPQGVLSQVLYDVCVPKNIEEWDIKLAMPSKGRSALTSSRKLSPFKPIRCLRRSRL